MPEYTEIYEDEYGALRARPASSGRITFEKKSSYKNQHGNDLNIYPDTTGYILEDLSLELSIGYGEAHLDLKKDDLFLLISYYYSLLDAEERNKLLHQMIKNAPVQFDS